MSKNEKVLKRRLVKWMKNYLTEAREEGLNDLINCYGIGEVNTTLLAEDCAYDSGIVESSVLDDETHVIWDAVIDAAEWFESI